jgi:hypothetical protein
MRRLITTSLLMLVLILVASCGEEEIGTDAGDDIEDSPTPTESVGDFPDQEPREVAVE